MTTFVSPDRIRGLFAQAMSDMYRSEVPLYGDLIELVGEINRAALEADPALAARLERNGEIERLDLERHGAIRVGTPAELAMLRRVFAIMGMQPVGYYDLTVAGVPVHSTAFRPLDEASLAANPFRIFTSLLRLELIGDPALRAEAEAILARRDIFTAGARALVEQAERDGGLGEDDARRFVAEVLETFRWHGDATVSLETYKALHGLHRLVADVVCFRGPHINHLTPRTLDIDAAQAGMLARGLQAKALIEGPPRRAVPILLRQTSFKALEEEVSYPDADGKLVPGSHTARFGEIEQRGLALTPAGRELYDRLLAEVRQAGGAAGNTAADYPQRLAAAFAVFPDDEATLRREGLGYFRYRLTEAGAAVPAGERAAMTPEAMIDAGYAEADPIVYEDFLPVSAAGIFQSNLGGGEQRAYDAHANQDAFEAALGATINDPFALYAQAQEASIASLRA
ncbi:2-oxoadipate dioxygenase/decarboxylase HglS [Pseudoxanthomonas suwonensis]|uniref:2-oxoadipate dioxygenase/decarboxylase HglS n=1 Tax=Pseudoxanthomonas suwonensis TaxID=314722 RepID=UPI0004915EB0|nr:VOC family protein [Pseudoxanthomonas suwonensis]